MRYSIKRYVLPAFLLVAVFLLPQYSGAAWTTEVVDTIGYVGKYNSLAIDQLDNIHICYHNYDTGYLMYATNSSGAWATTTIARADSRHCSIAVDSSNKSHVIFIYGGSLKYAANISNAWAIETVDSPASGLGGYLSIALDPSGKAHISYDESYPDYHVKYATNSSGTWSNQIVKTGAFGQDISIAVDPSGKSHISYTGLNGLNLYYSTNKSGSWVTQTIYAGNVYTDSLSLDSLGKVFVSYEDDFPNYDLKVATNKSGTWAKETVDSTGKVGRYSSLAIDSLNKLHIAYFDNTNGTLKFATNIAGVWQTEAVNNIGAYAQDISLRLDSSGDPHISYFDSINNELKHSTTAKFGIDDDADGYAERQGDCNDSNPLINPGVPEILYNGIDDDCNPATIDHTYILSVSIAGIGTGTITSSPAGITCGNDCKNIFKEGSIVSLKVSPDTDYTFTGWSGDPDCSDGHVTMTSAKNCIAVFDLMCTAKYTVTQLTDGPSNDYAPIINDTGQVVWLRTDGDWELYTYDGKSIKQLTNNNYDDGLPQINNKGNITWRGGYYSFEGNNIYEKFEIFLYDGKSIKQLTNNSYEDDYPQINDSGQVVWHGFDGNDHEIYLYDGTSIKQLTDNSFEDYYPQINNNGDVTWIGRDDSDYYISPLCEDINWNNPDCLPIDFEIFHYDGTSVNRLTYNGYEDEHPRISNSGYVVWDGYDGNDGEIFLLEGTSIHQLTDNSTEDGGPQIDNKGHVVWGGFDGDDRDIFLYDGASIHQLTNNAYADLGPHITNNGNIVWYGGKYTENDYPNGDYEIFFYDGTTHQVTYNDHDDVAPKISDNGQVVWYNENRDIFVGSTPGFDREHDGIPDYKEHGPLCKDTKYDGNHDGKPDFEQGNVASFPTKDLQEYVTLGVPDNTTLSGVLAAENPSTVDSPDASFPYGFFDFTVKDISIGDAVAVTLIIDGPPPNTYYRYGPTPDDHTDHWYEFLYDGRTGAAINGNVITLHFIDGERGDDDLTADGAIIDQGGPADTLSGGPIDLNLLSGWNLISLPRNPINASIEICLNNVTNMYNIVWAYENSEWKMNNPATPIFNTLDTMEAGKGYWIYMAQPGTMTVSGGVPSNSVQLANGWNLVGYNSKTAQPIEDVLASIDGKYISVWAFINGGWQFYAPGNIFNTLETMEPGYGYWINTTEACTWTLP